MALSGPVLPSPATTAAPATTVSMQALTEEVQHLRKHLAALDEGHVTTENITKDDEIINTELLP